MKAPMLGLLNRQGRPATAAIDNGVVTGYIKEVQWKQLQATARLGATAGSAIISGNPIDDEITWIRAGNAARQALKLKIGLGRPTGAIGATSGASAVPSNLNSFVGTYQTRAPTDGEGANEVQQVHITATGGTFKLTITAKRFDTEANVGPATTANIAYNATAAACQSAIVAALGAGTVTADIGVVKSSSTFVVTFQGRYRLEPQVAMTINTSSLTGGSGSISTQVEGKRPVEFPVTKFWTDDYLTAYEELIFKLSQKYDPNTYPEIAEVCISATITVYAEPFLRQTQAGGADYAGFNQASLIAAGYTRTADQEAIRRSIRAHGSLNPFGAAFANTRSWMTFFPHQYATAGGGGSDESFTIQMMDYLMDPANGVGPAHGVLGVTDYMYKKNKCASGTQTEKRAGCHNKEPSMYQQLVNRAGPLHFWTAQTETSSKLGGCTAASCDTESWAALLDGAVDQGVTAVELPGGYPYKVGSTSVSDGAMSAYNSQLAANAPTVTTGTATPTVPTALTLTREGDGVRLNWTASTDADGDLAGYVVYRTQTAPTSVAEAAITSIIPVTTYLDTTIVVGHTYKYRLKATDSASPAHVSGFSAYGTPDPFTVTSDSGAGPTFPAGANIAFSVDTDDLDIHLQWPAATDADAAVDYYMLTRTGGSVAFTPRTIPHVAGKVQFRAVDTGTTNNIHYTYTVLPYDTNGYPGQALVVHVTPHST